MWNENNAAIDAFAGSAASDWTAWLVPHTIHNIMGQGPVPNYRPAAGYVPAQPGSVSNGHVSRTCKVIK